MCYGLFVGVSLQLQSHYDFLAEKLGAEISQTVCEGAANNPLIMEYLPTLESEYYRREDGCEVHISLLFQYGVHVYTCMLIL